MLAIAEFTLRSPALVLSATLGAVPEVAVRIESQPAMDPEVRRFFVRVTAEDFDAFEAALADDPSVAAPNVVTDAGSTRVYRLRLTDEVTVVSPAATTAGGIVLDMESRGAAWFLRLQIPDRDVLAEFRSFCRNEGVAFDLERLYHVERATESPSPLTDEQHRTLVTAYRTGYFDVPRRTTQRELADELDVSDSAVSQRVRRATAALVAETLVEEDPD